MTFQLMKWRQLSLVSSFNTWTHTYQSGRLSTMPFKSWLTLCRRRAKNKPLKSKLLVKDQGPILIIRVSSARRTKTKKLLGLIRSPRIWTFLLLSMIKKFRRTAKQVQQRFPRLSLKKSPWRPWSHPILNEKSPWSHPKKIKSTMISSYKRHNLVIRKDQVSKQF